VLLWLVSSQTDRVEVELVLDVGQIFVKLFGSAHRVIQYGINILSGDLLTCSRNNFLSTKFNHGQHLSVAYIVFLFSVFLTFVLSFLHDEMVHLQLASSSFHNLILYRAFSD
jgi:hypothetical protein